MIATQRSQAGWTRGVVTFLAALAVAWAMLAGPSVAGVPGDLCPEMQSGCAHAAAMQEQATHGAMRMDQPCENEMNCPSPDCTITTGSITAGTFDAAQQARPDARLEICRRAISSRPHSFAPPTPKQPPKI